MNRAEGVALLRAAVAEVPAAVVGRSLDGSAVVLVLERLGRPADGVQIGQALRWSGAERVAAGVWLVPVALLAQNAEV